MPMSSNTSRVAANAINDHFVKVFAGTGVWDAASVATAAQTSNTITIPGVILGDAVIAVGCDASPGGFILSAAVTAADTVTVYLSNVSGGAIDLASTTFKVVVGRVAAFPA